MSSLPSVEAVREAARVMTNGLFQIALHVKGPTGMTLPDVLKKIDSQGKPLGGAINTIIALDRLATGDEITYIIRVIEGDTACAQDALQAARRIRDVVENRFFEWATGGSLLPFSTSAHGRPRTSERLESLCTLYAELWIDLRNLRVPWQEGGPKGFEVLKPRMLDERNTMRQRAKVVVKSLYQLLGRWGGRWVDRREVFLRICAELDKNALGGECEMYTAADLVEEIKARVQIEPDQADGSLRPVNDPDQSGVELPGDIADAYDDATALLDLLVQAVEKCRYLQRLHAVSGFKDPGSDQAAFDLSRNTLWVLLKKIDEGVLTASESMRPVRSELVRSAIRTNSSSRGTIIGIPADCAHSAVLNIARRFSEHPLLRSIGRDDLEHEGVLDNLITVATVNKLTDEIPLADGANRANPEILKSLLLQEAVDSASARQSPVARTASHQAAPPASNGSTPAGASEAVSVKDDLFQMMENARRGLSDKAKLLIPELLRRGSVDESSRSKLDDLAKAIGGEFSTADNYKSASAELGSKYITAGKDGKNGGIWLTPLGVIISNNFHG